MSNGNTDLSGFTYGPSGKAEPAGTADLELFEAIDALRDAMAASDRKAPWVAALIRINRVSGAITADFDYEDPDRWSVDLGNLAASADRPRPS